MIERRDQSVRDVLHRVMGLSSECDELDLGIMIMEVWWTEPTVIYLIVKGLLKQLSVRLWSNRRQLKLVSLTIFECGLGWFLLFNICTISSKWETARTEIPHCHHKLWFAKPHVGAYVVMHVTTTIALNSPNRHHPHTHGQDKALLVSPTYHHHMSEMRRNFIARMRPVEHILYIWVVASSVSVMYIWIFTCFYAESVSVQRVQLTQMRKQ